VRAVFADSGGFFSSFPDLLPTCATHISDSHILRHYGKQPAVLAHLAAVPGLDATGVQVLVSGAADPSQHRSGVKARRQAMRKVLSGLIGVNVGQRLRYQADVRPLSVPLILQTKKPAVDLLSTEDANLNSLFDS
jgi:hypothetical protein